MTGYTSDEMIGTSIINLYGDEKEASRIGKLLYTSEGQITNQETFIRNKNNEQIPISLSASFLNRNNASSSGIVNVLRDLRDILKLQEQLIDKERKLAATDILTQTMVTVSHYMNNALAGIVSYIQYLQMKWQQGVVEDKNTGVLKKVINAVKQETTKIQAVITALKSITDPESTTYLGDVQMLDIEEEFKEALEQLKKLNLLDSDSKE